MFDELAVDQIYVDLPHQLARAGISEPFSKMSSSADDIRSSFELKGLVPQAVLPNPNIDALLAKAFNKLSQYRKALVEIVKQFGGALLNELRFEPSLTISVGVDIGFPPRLRLPSSTRQRKDDYRNKDSHGLLSAFAKELLHDT